MPRRFRSLKRRYQTVVNQNIVLNPHVSGLRESSTLAINMRARALRQAGRRVAHFGFGQSPFPVPEPLQDALRANVHQSAYLPTQGLPALREAVVDFYAEHFGYPHLSPDLTFVGPGSKELLFQLIYLLEGDLLIPAPSWVSYGPQAYLRGKKVVRLPTRRDNGYKLTADSLDAVCDQLGHGPKLLVLNNPNNPTGSVYTDAECRDLAAICRAYGIIVLCDEIYAMLDFTGRPQASIARHYPEGCVISGGLSKVFAAGGYRLGVMMLPPELAQLRHPLVSLISETFSAVSAPTQYAAITAYRDFDQLRPFVERTRGIHEVVCRYVHRRLSAAGLACPRPDGGFYLFPDFNAQREGLRAQGILTSQHLAESLLEPHGIAALPGSDFYLPASYLGLRISPVDYEGAAALELPGEPSDFDVHQDPVFGHIRYGCDQFEAFTAELNVELPQAM